MTLDLAGHTLNAQALIVFGAVEDSSETGETGLPQGGLKVDNTVRQSLVLGNADLSAEGSEAVIPAWDTEGCCYRFYTVSKPVMGFKDVAGTGFDFKYRCRPIASHSEAWEKILASGSGVTVGVDVMVEKSGAGEGSVEEGATTSKLLHYNFAFDDPELIGAWLENPTGSSFVLSGTAGEAVVKVSFTPQICLNGTCIVSGNTSEWQPAA